MKKFQAVVIVSLVSLFLLAVCFPAWGAKTIKIGVIGPMQFVQGKGHWNGAMMAAEEINAAGGVLGRMIQPVIEAVSEGQSCTLATAMTLRVPGMLA